MVEIKKLQEGVKLFPITNYTYLTSGGVDTSMVPLNSAQLSGKLFIRTLLWAGVYTTACGEDSEIPIPHLSPFASLGLCV